MLPIRIMIAVGDAAEMQTVSSLLRREGDIEVVSTVSSRETAIKQLSNSPDVLVLDPEILKGHTLSRFIRSIQTRSPHTRVMYLFGNVPPDESIIADIKTGIRGYFKTTDTPATIIKAIHAVQRAKYGLSEGYWKRPSKSRCFCPKHYRPTCRAFRR